MVDCARGIRKRTYQESVFFGDKNELVIQISGSMFSIFAEKHLNSHPVREY